MTSEEKRAQRNHEAREDWPGCESAARPSLLDSIKKLVRRVLRRPDPTTPPESNP